MSVTDPLWQRIGRPRNTATYQRMVKIINENKDTKYAPLALISPYLIYLIALFVVPLIYMFIISFYRNVSGAGMEAALTLENYITFFSHPRYLEVLYITVEVSIISTIVTIAASYPIAHFIVFNESRYTKYLIFLVIAPMLVGNVVRAFGWFALMGRSGLITDISAFLGYEYVLLNTKPGLIIAISSVLMPFAILILMSVLYSLDIDLVYASYNVGANRVQSFAYVIFPLILPGVIAATLLSFVLTMGTFATAVFIGMPQIPMLGPVIYNQATSELNWPLAAAMSFVLLAVSFILIYLYIRFANQRRGGSDSSSADRKSFRFSKMLQYLDTGRSIGGLSVDRVIWSSILAIGFFYLLVPVVFAIMISFNPSDLYTFPPEYITLEWYEVIATRPMWVSSFITSFIISFFGAVIAIVLGTMVSYALQRFDFPGRNILDSATLLPLMIPQIILGLALLIFLADYGLTGTVLGMSLALGVIASPYAIRAIMANMENMDRSIEEAAMNLGADEIQTFRKITLPSMMPGILTATVLAFIVSYANLQVVIFLQGPGQTPIPVRIYAQMHFGAEPSIAAVATVNIAIVIGAIAVIERYFNTTEALGVQ